MPLPLHASAAGPSIASPCRGICMVDGPHRLCRGCARTLNEIASWLALPGPARLAILEQLPARKAALAAERPGEIHAQS